MKKDTASTEKKVPGRPRAFDRRKAVELAVNLFWRHGYDGTSTAMLTSAMGISPPSLYAAFGSKEKLYGEVLASYANTYGVFMESAFAAAKTARDAIEKMLLNAAVQFADSKHVHGCLISTSSLQHAPENPQIAAEVSGYRLAARDAIRARIEMGRKSGELPKTTDTLAMASFYAALIQGMAIQASDGASAELLKKVARLGMQSWPKQ